MSTVTLPSTITFPVPLLPTHWNLGDLQSHLGDIPLERIRLFPPPGMATEDDAHCLRAAAGVLCEVVDGVLVEKAMGSYESALAFLLGRLMGPYLDQHPIGILLGADGMLRLAPGKSRIPDVSFLSWTRFPNRKVPKDRVWSLAPDLAVEILSDGNTRREIDLKLNEYFASGTQLVWIIDPPQRTARIYTSREESTTIDATGELHGGNVLPGFTLVLSQLLDAIPQEE